MTRTIIRRLRYQTMGQRPTILKDVKQLRQCDIDLRHADQQHDYSHDHDHKHENGYSTDQSGLSKASKTSRTSKGSRSRGYYRTNQHSEETLERLRQENKCFRCQKPGHMASNEDAPCRGKDRRRTELPG